MAAARGVGQRKALLAGHEAEPFAHLRAKADATLGELRRWLFETRGGTRSVGALWNGLDRPGWTLKKSQHAAGQKRADVAAATAGWRALQPG